MPKVNDIEIKQILQIQNRKGELTDAIDKAINDLTYVRMAEREWWKAIVDKYHLNKKKLHRIWLDGEIIDERRIRNADRKIF